jgi:hypothetical protein
MNLLTEKVEQTVTTIDGTKLIRYYWPEFNYTEYILFDKFKQ